MTRIVFRNAHVLDGLSVLGKADVVVEGERITEVRPLSAPSPVRDDDVVYDLQGKTLMPGMVAGHGHFSLHGLSLARFMEVDMQHPGPYMAVVAAKNARKTLEAGFTTYVGAGAIHNLDVVLKNLIADGVIEGPRIVPCSRDFVPTGHVVDYKPEHWNVQRTATGGLGAICDGPEEFRKEIRLEAKRGAQIIKLYPEGGHGLSNRTVKLSYEEIAAAVETATLCGLRVRAHVYSKPTIKACLKAGIAIVDHGDHLDEELVELFVKHGTYVLPSLYLAKSTIGVYHTQQDFDGWVEYARKSLPMGVAAGVKFVTGDDFGLLETPHGDNAKELALYVDELGLPPLEVIKWATVNGAEMSQIPDIGRIAPGRLADLVVVDGDPIARIDVLTWPECIALVMKNGSIAKSTLAAAGRDGRQAPATSAARLAA